eukprot:m.59948 g.59948  ORF g.59948 m.59948 type:complete len:87 (+) comp15722_c0_seq8:152-412(+)
MPRQCATVVLATKLASGANAMLSKSNHGPPLFTPTLHRVCGSTHRVDDSIDMGAVNAGRKSALSVFGMSSSRAATLASKCSTYATW